ncbi:MAG: hypothetical protein AAGI01_08970, partial [Myxococcota bacterium]
MSLLTLSACGNHDATHMTSANNTTDATDTTETNDTTPDMAPMEFGAVTVADQLADPANQVVVASVVSVGPGFVVLHEEDGAGVIGDAIGFEGVSDGDSADVTVSLERDAVDGETLYAMLYVDAGAEGIYEFPGPDAPALDAGGVVIASPFVVSVEDTAVTPSVTVRDQVTDPAGMVLVAEAVSAGPGWLVLHEEDGAGMIGAVLGFSQLSDGTNTDVTVSLERDAVDG